MAPSLQNPDDIWTLMSLGRLLKLGKERRRSVDWRETEERIRRFLHFPAKSEKSPVWIQITNFRISVSFFLYHQTITVTKEASPHGCFIILAGWARTCLCHFRLRFCKLRILQKHWKEHVACAEHNHLLAYCTAWCWHTTVRHTIWMYFTVLTLICSGTNSCFFCLKGPDTYCQYSSSMVLKG